MPDFDGFERSFKAALARDSDDVELFAREIAELPESQKVAVVKGRSEREVIDFLRRARFALRERFPENSRFTSSQNNMDENDLREEVTGTNIELKSGPQQTAANSGLSTISWALDDAQGKISDIMGIRSMTTRRRLYLSGDMAGVERSKVETMNQLHSLFSSKVSAGSIPPAKLEHFVRCVGLGFTKLSAIKSRYAGNPLRSPLMLQANWVNGLEVYDSSYLPDESLVVSEVSRTDGRAQIKIRGRDSGTETCLYPNYKNSWHSSNGLETVPAENWVQTACFHIFIN